MIKLIRYVEKGEKISINIYKQNLIFDNKISEEAKDLIKNLLIFNPENRLGSGVDGGDKIKNHKFFYGVNWNDVWGKKLKPPFVPELKSEQDLKYFDSSFTDESIGSLLSRSGSFRDRGLSNEYNGFSYLAPSVGKELNEMAKDE